MNNEGTYTPAYRQNSILCIICGESLTVRLTRGRKSGKPSVMLICSNDGRHFRAFINDREYIRQVLKILEPIA